MKYPWANTLLLILLVGELVTGFFGLVSGSPDEALFIILHRIFGYGLLVLLVWKAYNIVLSLKWPRSYTPRVASLFLLVLLVLTLGLGFAWSYVGPYYFWLFSGVSWHIYIGGVLVPLLIWHAIYHTHGVPAPFWMERRSFLRLTGVALVGALLWRTGEGIASASNLSGASRRFTGSYESGNFSGNAFPLTSWLNDNPAPVKMDEWRLRVTGAVEQELLISYAEMHGEATLTATLDCTGGWHSTQEWRGVLLSDVLGIARPLESASSITVTSVTGYYRRFSMKEAQGYLLATHVGQERLSHGHGFPLRLVAYDKRGFEWVKWVDTITVNTTPKWLQPPLPLQ